jgi:hypothetical protein
MRIVLFLYLFLSVALGSISYSSYGKDRVGKLTKPVIAKKRLTAVKDTPAKDSIPSDSLPDLKLTVTRKIEYNGVQNSIMPDPSNMSLFPAVSLQQFLKSNAAGVYIQEETGE